MENVVFSVGKKKTWNKYKWKELRKNKNPYTIVRMGGSFTKTKKKLKIKKQVVVVMNVLSMWEESRNKNYYIKHFSS